ncbi:kinase [Thraustotheca clavata]|uniref:Kinase n=1 Tax=Thraustotheca clavata TaxID=74557 RepID=A0A1W0A726_9STRA|nr:kinase [Thraustotheca clavata]
MSLNDQLRQLLGDEITEKQLLEKFSFEKVVGSGATAKVYIAYDYQEKREVAIKVFDKAMMIEQRKSIANDGYNSKDTAVQRARRRLKKIICEIDIAKRLDHDNIIKYLGGYETSHRICIVQELVDGTDLLQHILDEDKMGETTAAYVFEQLLRALEYCHSYNVWHRDLKLENVLISSSHQIKLIDFGLSERTEEFLKTVCGTPLYCAPELLFLNSNTRATGVHGGPADIWSAGVLLFALVTGCAPFDDSTFASLRQDVYRNAITYPETMSLGLQEFLRSIFVTDVRVRPSISELLAHPWLVQNVANYKIKMSPTAYVKPPRTVSVISDAETVEESNASCEDDDNGPEDVSYRDMLYDEMLDDELYLDDSPRDVKSPRAYYSPRKPSNQTSSKVQVNNTPLNCFAHLF